jgi:hypothetical protein
MVGCSPALILRFICYDYLIHITNRQDRSLKQQSAYHQPGLTRDVIVFNRSKLSFLLFQ